jgi:AP2 domain/HNH endonuclease
MPKQIPLSQGKFAIVDDADFEQLSQHKWNAQRNGHTFYAFRTGKRTIYLHRQLMGALPGQQVDHRDTDGLNNQRDNLRLCSAGENRRNMRKTRGSSKFKGVSWDKVKAKWTAIIYRDYKKHPLGRFDNEEDAARAYDAKAKELFGEFARLNFPVSGPVSLPTPAIDHAAAQETIAV